MKVASNIYAFPANAKQRWWDCCVWSTAHNPKHLNPCCFVHQLVSSTHRMQLALILALLWSLFAMVGTGQPLACTSQDADLPSSEWRGTVQAPWRRPHCWLLLVGNESLLQAAVLQQTTDKCRRWSCPGTKACSASPCCTDSSPGEPNMAAACQSAVSKQLVAI